MNILFQTDRRLKVMSVGAVVFGFVCMLASCGTPNTLSCSQSATYQLTFSASWSSTTHPTDFPMNPHFSPMVGTTHNNSYILWRDGGVASDGVENMAELGQTAGIETEVADAISAGTAENVIVADSGISLSPGTANVTFSITESFSLVSVVTMIAPSPDWFVGVDSVDLCDGTNWKNTLSLELQPYDSGTDSGVTFTSADADVTPHQPIAEITGEPFLKDGNVAPMGVFTFERL